MTETRCELMTRVGDGTAGPVILPSDNDSGWRIKLLGAVTGLFAALNLSVASARGFLTTLQDASEPVGLATWGLVLFILAAGIKRHGQSKRMPRRERARGVEFPLTRFERGL